MAKANRTPGCSLNQASSSHLDKQISSSSKARQVVISQVSSSRGFLAGWAGHPLYCCWAGIPTSLAGCLAGRHPELLGAPKLVLA